MRPGFGNTDKDKGCQYEKEEKDAHVPFHICGREGGREASRASSKAHGFVPLAAYGVKGRPMVRVCVETPSIPGVLFVCKIRALYNNVFLKGCVQSFRTKDVIEDKIGRFSPDYKQFLNTALKLTSMMCEEEGLFITHPSNHHLFCRYGRRHRRPIPRHQTCFLNPCQSKYRPCKSREWFPRQ